MTTWNEVTLIDGKVHNLKYGRHFNVSLGDGVNPAISPTVDFEGMPIQTLVELAWDALKVRSRVAVLKKLNQATLLKQFDGKEVGWRMMLSKAHAAQQASYDEMDASGLQAEIEKLQAKMEAKIESEME